MAYFEVQKVLKEREKENKDKIFLTSGVVEEMIDRVNKAGSNKDLNFIGIRSVDWGFIGMLSGGDGVGALLKDSYKYFEEGKKPPIVTFGNLQTAHMIRLKRAYENLDLRILLKRKQEAIKKKSENLNLNQRNIAKLKNDLFILMTKINLQ